MSTVHFERENQTDQCQLATKTGLLKSCLNSLSSWSGIYFLEGFPTKMHCFKLHLVFFRIKCIYNIKYFHKHVKSWGKCAEAGNLQSLACGRLIQNNMSLSHGVGYTYWCGRLCLLAAEAMLCSCVGYGLVDENIATLLPILHLFVRYVFPPGREWQY